MLQLIYTVNIKRRRPTKDKILLAKLTSQICFIFVLCIDKPWAKFPILVIYCQKLKKIQAQISLDAITPAFKNWRHAYTPSLPLSHIAEAPSPSSVTHFMDGPCTQISVGPKSNHPQFAFFSACRSHFVMNFIMQKVHGMPHTRNASRLHALDNL